MKYPLLLALVVGLFCGCDHPQVHDPQSAVEINECARRLQIIDDAKARWAEQNQKTANDTPTIEDLKSVLRGVPGCTSGGTYTITHVGELSTCSIPEHTATYKKLAASGVPAQ